MLLVWAKKIPKRKNPTQAKVNCKASYMYRPNKRRHSHDSSMQTQSLCWEEDSPACAPSSHLIVIRVHFDNRFLVSGPTVSVKRGSFHTVGLEASSRRLRETLSKRLTFRGCLLLKKREIAPDSIRRHSGRPGFVLLRPWIRLRKDWGEDWRGEDDRSDGEFWVLKREKSMEKKSLAYFLSAVFWWKNKLSIVRGFQRNKRTAMGKQHRKRVSLRIFLSWKRLKGSLDDWNAPKIQGRTFVFAAYEMIRTPNLVLALCEKAHMSRRIVQSNIIPEPGRDPIDVQTFGKQMLRISESSFLPKIL